MDEVFKALGDPTRIRIVRMLAERGEVCVCTIVEELGVRQSAVSFHMNKLKQTGLLHGRREGQWIHYSLNVEAFETGPQAFLNELVSVAKRGADGSRRACGIH